MYQDTRCSKVIFGLGKLGYKLEKKFNKNVVNLFANSKKNGEGIFLLQDPILLSTLFHCVINCLTFGKKKKQTYFVPHLLMDLSTIFPFIFFFKHGVLNNTTDWK